MSNVLEISHLQKHFGEKNVLEDVTLSVPEHCVFGFIGRNGAGKTTVMRTVLGLLSPDGGDIFVCGERVRCGNTPTNRFVGYLPDVPEFYGFMTAPEYLTFCGEITGMEKKSIKNRREELLELVGLSDEKHRIKGFSRGMKQRLGIAQALINRPHLLICDEPTSALDPAGRREVLDILLSAKEQTSVVFSTHILPDVEKICDQVALLEHGKVILSGSVDEIRKSRRSPAIELLPEGDPAFVRQLFPEAEMQDGKLIFSNGGTAELERIMDILLREHIPIRRLERREPDLEDLFLEVIGK